ncbi:hypothetical protein SEA_MARLEY1013_53 [Mycobacterium phage Marley1013]|nr:hypothetical protein SEA_MARLEY1013_53 [Mycobacterium phage Marley1013]
MRDEHATLAATVGPCDDFAADGRLARAGRQDDSGAEVSRCPIGFDTIGSFTLVRAEFTRFAGCVPDFGAGHGWLVSFGGWRVAGCPAGSPPDNTDNTE